MKKTLLALAALGTWALAQEAAAQSGVTLFGVVDVGLAWGGSDANHLLRVRESGHTTSRFGLRGTEDLGGGLAAGFWLEGGFDPSDGAGGQTNTSNQPAGVLPTARGGLTFNRRAIVWLRGGWGELRAGREYTPSFWNWTIFDPYATTGVGTSQLLNSGSVLVGPAAVRASNSLTYSTPGCYDAVGCSGFYGQAQLMLGENASNAAGGTRKDGSGGSFRLGYAAGPWNAALGHGRIRYATTAAAGNVTQSNVGLSYQWGAASLKLLLSRDRVDALVPLTGRGWQAGANIPFGSDEVRVSYGRYETDAAGAPHTGKLSLGYVRHLSRRTALYATVARLGNGGGAAQALNGATGVANGSSSGWDLGMKHSF